MVMSTRTRHHLPEASRRRRQPQAISDGVQQQVVDLTCDDYNFVDLTNFDHSGSPVTISDTPSRRSVARAEENLRSPYLVSDASVSDDDDLPPPPFKVTLRVQSKQSTVSSPQPGGSRVNAAPRGECPICMDSFAEVKASGRQVMSTTCGHVFCEECVKGVLGADASARKCPTCRKKLSSRAVHPLFI